MDIANQKVVAENLLGMFSSVDKNVTLSGGAPRNWERGIPANDLDFYISAWPSQINSLLGARFKNFQVLGDPEFLQMYESNPNLKVVLTNENFDGCKVQLMFVEGVIPEQVTREFPLSCCQIWYDTDFILHRTNLYVEAEIDKVLVKSNKLYGKQDRYIDKIRSYYPERPFFDSVSSYNTWRLANGKTCV